MDISNKSIAILVEQQYQEMELWYPKFRFWEEGAEVSLIGPEKGAHYLSKVGYPAEADEAAKDVKGSDFDALHPHVEVVDGTETLYISYLFLDRMSIGIAVTGGAGSIFEIGTPNPMLPQTWDSDAVSHPWVTELPTGGYQMWYVGNDGSNDRIGAAFGSTGGLDGVDFLRQGIVLDLGTPGAWDDTHVSSPTVMLGEAPWRMWYAGSDGTTWRVGLAEGVCAP